MSIRVRPAKSSTASAKPARIHQIETIAPPHGPSVPQAAAFRFDLTAVTNQPVGLKNEKVGTFNFSLSDMLKPGSARSGVTSAVATASAIDASSSTSASHSFKRDAEINRLELALGSAQHDYTAMVSELRAGSEREHALSRRLDAAKEKVSMSTGEFGAAQAAFKQLSTQAAATQRSLGCAMQQIQSHDAEKVRLESQSVHACKIVSCDLAIARQQVKDTEGNLLKTEISRQELQMQLEAAVQHIGTLDVQFLAASAKVDAAEATSASASKSALVLSAKAKASQLLFNAVLTEPAIPRAICASVDSIPKVVKFSSAAQNGGPCLLAHVEQMSAPAVEGQTPLITASLLDIKAALEARSTA